MKSRLLPLLVAVLLAATLAAAGATEVGNPGVYTQSADFAQGTLVNVNSGTPDQLQLDSESTPFNFIWVAASGRGTIVKIDTLTGDILGEYWSAPENRPKDPSRTTVDGDGSVWATNRAENGLIDGLMSGSVVKIGLLENGGCVDRNDDGDIDTSTGLGDILAWPNAGGEDDYGGVSTAVDECILLYVRLPDAPYARHVSVNADNDVWVGGYNHSPRTFHLLDGDTGAIVPGSTFHPECGGYGGLIDANNVIWSASIDVDHLLRWDVGAGAGTCIDAYGSYGLGIDSQGNVWNADYRRGAVYKFSPAGSQLGWWLTWGFNSRGVVAGLDDNIWVVDSASDIVNRFQNNGVRINVFGVGDQPTGVAVDGAGKIWVTNLSSNDVMRIDPASNAVDLTVGLGAGAAPYNYSDMTGSTLIAPPDKGTWTVVHDSGMADAPWSLVTWNADTPGDSGLKVFIASSADNSTFGPEEEAANGVPVTVDPGQYLRVRVEFTRATTGETPVLYDLTVLANRAPDCTAAAPSLATLWPPNHQFVQVGTLGVTDPDDDEVTITVTGIRQDEPVDTLGDGNFVPDGQGVGTATAELRAERAGTKKAPGNGRVYHVYVTATDPYGASCTADLSVTVLHDPNKPAIDDGPAYDSTVP